jgi:hypothetical protein
MQVGPEYAPITSEYLDYDEVMGNYDTDDGLAGRSLCEYPESDPVHA